MTDADRARQLADEIEAHTAAFGGFEALGVKVHENRHEVITALRRCAESSPTSADRRQVGAYGGGKRIVDAVESAVLWNTFTDHAMTSLMTAGFVYGPGIVRDLADEGLVIVAREPTPAPAYPGECVGRWVTVRVYDVGGDLVIDERDAKAEGIPEDVSLKTHKVDDTHARVWVPEPENTRQGREPTGAMIEAALLAFDPGFGPIDEAHKKMWSAKMRRALVAARAAEDSAQ